MKNWDTATPEEIADEAQKVFAVMEDETTAGRDIVIPFEAALYLSQYPILASFYFSIKLLQEYDLLSSSTHKEIAIFLGMTEMTFLKHRDQLVAHKLIKLQKSPVSNRGLQLTPLRIPRLPDKEYMRWYATHGKQGQLKLLTHWRTLIHPLSEEEQQEEHKKLVQEQANLFQKEEIVQKIKQGVQAVVKKNTEARKAKEAKFPQHDYISIIDGYKRTKGVSLQPRSPDESRVRHAAKQMFLSGHTVPEIVACMKFFQEHCRREEYSWMSHWTIETVMKKMPEFKAGKLKLPEMGDNLERI